MCTRILSICALLFIGARAHSEINEIQAKEVLRQADAARGNLDGVTWTVDISEGDNESTSRTIRVQARGFNMLAETLSPPRQKGHKLLLVQNNMWFYKPDLSKPVPVSLRQKLSGRAANGDLASTNYAEDYTVLSISENDLDGQACFVFELEAISRNVTYARIRYWVSKEQLVGLRADYYNTAGNKLLKTASMSYHNEVIVDGIKRPFISKMQIRDAIDNRAATSLRFSIPELGEIPARIFNPNALNR